MLLSILPLPLIFASAELSSPPTSMASLSNRAKSSLELVRTSDPGFLLDSLYVGHVREFGGQQKLQPYQE
jgi:hypothetical protein